MLTATKALRSRPVASPVSTPTTVVIATAATSEGRSGQPAFVRRRASEKAPIPRNAPWPSEGMPASPTAYASPTAASAR